MDVDGSRTAVDWPERLVAAVDADNDSPPSRCDELKTADVLRVAPEWAREHASLALADLAAAGQGPIDDLRADAVATGFIVAPADGHPNVLVARMLVPGGPWPGHRGIEAVVFRSRSSRMPTWFPDLGGEEEMVTFAETVASSAALRSGHGHVIFPELLAVSKPLAAQRFGIVLVDHLANLYRAHAVPMAAELGWLVADEAADDGDLRMLAFQAHEWGHRAMDDGYAENVPRHRRRLLAVVSEIVADVAALEMLFAAAHPLAPDVARALVLDRILREAWLSRWESHVASIVGRLLIQILSRAGALSERSGALILDLDAARDSLGFELALLGRAYRASNRGDDAAAIRYLAENGWTVQADGIAPVDPMPVVEQLGRRVASAQPA
jgi:hypothetical protein